MPRRLGILTATVMGALALLVGVDWSFPRGALDAAAILTEPFFQGCGPLAPHKHPERHLPGPRPIRGFRLATPASEVRIQGLLAGARVEVVATLASALPKAQQVTVWAAGVPVRQEWVGNRYGAVSFSTMVPEGELRLRFSSPAGSGAAFRLAGAEVRHSSGGRVPTRRVLYWAALLLLSASLGSAAGHRGAVSGVLLATGLLLWGLLATRLTTLGHLTHLLSALVVSSLFSLACRRLLHPPRWAVGGLTLAFGLKVLLATHSAFPCIDVLFHAHNVQAFRGGDSIRSAVTGPQGELLAIPYGPALSALLALLVPSQETSTMVAWLRWVMVILEGTAPLLVLGMARSARASPRAAALAALAMAAMPEGLLVIGKGIAANLLGAWLASAVVVVVLAGCAAPVVALTAALAFLAHPGSGATLAALLSIWLGWQAMRGTRAREAGRALLWVGCGLGVAWAIGYREAVTLSTASLTALASQAGEAPGRFFAFRWVHLGKLAQDLVLKFGGGPLGLAFLFVSRRGIGPPALRGLVVPWLAVTAVLALVALLTPFAVRFEYFALPALALAAGCLGDELISRGRVWPVAGALGVSLLVQLALGLLLLFGHFDLINVIIPSPRWPLVGWPR